jgi:hypothetical protein
MIQPEPVNEFKKGLTALLEGHPRSAVAYLRNAIDQDGANPFYVSYYGLALARTGLDWSRAEKFCLAALRVTRTQAHLYLNLAEVYRRAGKTEYAWSTLSNGLQFTRCDRRLVRALESLGIRRPPVLSFLDRRHFLNRQLGKLRHRLRGQAHIPVPEALRIADT